MRWWDVIYRLLFGYRTQSEADHLSEIAPVRENLAVVDERIRMLRAEARSMSASTAKPSRRKARERIRRRLTH